MALSIGVKTGMDISVGRDILTVVEVPDPFTVYLSVNDNPTVKITRDERVEVLPHVFISCGMPDRGIDLPGHSRLTFEAPRSIRIERMPYVPALV